MIMEENFHFTAAFCANIVAGFRLLDGAGLERLKNDLDHLATDGASLAGGEVTVVALVEVYANLVCCLLLELLKSLLCLLVSHFVLLRFAPIIS